jgi:hypothetical protein
VSVVDSQGEEITHLIRLNTVLDPRRARRLASVADRTSSSSLPLSPSAQFDKLAITSGGDLVPASDGGG